jgi:hypothetical protein
MSFPHLGGVLKLGFTSSFVPISKWVKLDTLLKIPEVKQKLKSLVIARGHKENQNKTIWLPPAKHFL